MKPYCADLKSWSSRFIKSFFASASDLSFDNYISIDIETTGNNLFHDQIHFMTYDLNGKTGVVIMRPDLVKKPKFPSEVLKAMNDRRVKKIIHSSQFDVPFIRQKTGIHLRNIWDTQVVEQVILGGRGNPWTDSALKQTLERRKIAKMNKDIRDTFIGYFGPITTSMIDYGLKDIKYLKELSEVQIEVAKELNVENVVELENKTCEVTAELRFNGVEFDEQLWIEIAEESMAEYQKRIDKLPKEVDNWNSEKQVKEFFLNKHHIQIDSLTDLPDIKNKDLDAFKHARSLYSAVSTYGLGFLQRKGSKKLGQLYYNTVDPDGRIRPSYNQIVDTGRYSCSKPNLQNQPAFGRHRYCYTAKDGHTLVVGDFTGQELGVIAVGSQEPVWLEAMRKGWDLHSVMADKIFLNWKEIGDKKCTFPFKCKCEKHLELRRPAKDLNFGLAYGKGVEAFARDSMIHINEARQIFNKYKRSIPKVVRWLENNGYFTVKHGYSRTLPPFNRIRFVEGEDWRLKNQGKNSPVQGSGADMMKLSMCMIYEFIYAHGLETSIKLVLTVHDELLTEVKKSLATKWSDTMKFFMEEAAVVITKEKLITTEPEIMDRWKPKR